jgi:hypothetical protein
MDPAIGSTSNLVTNNNQAIKTATGRFSNRAAPSVIHDISAPDHRGVFRKAENLKLAMGDRRILARNRPAAELSASPNGINRLTIPRCHLRHFVDDRFILIHVVRRTTE